MSTDVKKVIPNADLKHIKGNPKTGTYSWDVVI